MERRAKTRPTIAGKVLAITRMLAKFVAGGFVGSPADTNTAEATGACGIAIRAGWGKIAELEGKLEEQQL